MALDLLRECTFTGPALPEPFVRFELEKELARADLLPKASGEEGRTLQDAWEAYRRKLRELAFRGGAIRVRNHVLEPLVARLGYARLEPAEDVKTREGRESGGHLLITADGGARLRTWCTDLEEDLEAPARRGAAYRYSHLRIAQRVLLTCGERLGLLTNGVELRLLISDPARPDSQVIIAMDPQWKRHRDLPDSYRLVLALASPAGVRALPALVEKARLQQTRVTKELRLQARQAIELFIQEALDHPNNQEPLQPYVDKPSLARALWREGLITVYRLLFILKLEASDDPARSFSFASTSLWRHTFSPSVALAPHVEAVLDRGAETGSLLESGLRALFRMFAEGLQCTELNVQPLGGALFGADATPLLSKWRWGERGVAYLLDRLLWTPRQRGSNARERVHYGSLDVEDLGRVYEALRELEPGIAAEPMCRLRRRKLEVVVPIAQGETYRPASVEETPWIIATEETEGLDEAAEEVDNESGAHAQKTKVEWIEAIRPGRFYLRVGIGRKATGSYYTPHSFVRFLVQETLGPLVAKRSPQEDPKPGDILKLKVLDPAMGSGHFLVEACRFLGEKLYEAFRLCDERALAAGRRAEQAHTDAERHTALIEADEYRQRIQDLPDPDDELVRYLPSRAPEGEESGLSQKKAEALCRRLVAIHSLYGVDKNPLAVELAKLALWIESHAEGLPLTFLDHRLVIGDSLTGPFFEHLLRYPGTQEPLDDLFTQGLRENFTNALANALKHVHDISATVGATLAEIEAKQLSKARLDRVLAPFKILAAAWAGGVMLRDQQCDDMAYAELVRSMSDIGDLPGDLSNESRLLRMIARGLGVEEAPTEQFRLLDPVTSPQYNPALAYEIAFPEVFFRRGELGSRQGFDAVIGNPPWDTITIKRKEWFANYDFKVLTAATKRESEAIEQTVLSDPVRSGLFERYVEEFEQRKRVNDVYYCYQKMQIEGDLAGRFLDEFRVFMERNLQILDSNAMTGVVVPSAFHANEGATGVRRLYLEGMALKFCYSFENRRKLFEIDSRFKFALVVASRPGPTEDFSCAFYLHDDEWLFGARSDRELHYTADFVGLAGGPFLSLLEIRNTAEFGIVNVCYQTEETIGQLWDREGQSFSTSEINLTLDKERLVSLESCGVPNGWLTVDNQARLIANGAFPLAEGKSLWHFDILFSGEARYAIPFQRLADKRHWFKLACYYRSAYRKIASSTNERTMVWCIISPGIMTCESCPSEQAPWKRPNGLTLCRIALLNAFVPDFLLRLRVAATVSMFMLRSTPIPRLPEQAKRFLAHVAIRLHSQDNRFEPLWREQLGAVWLEGKASFTWPVLGDGDERWEIRAAIDAMVADAYGLSREQYARVLSTFSHRSYPKAPKLCLACFDELKAIGLEAFMKKYDPYWDVPLNENLPQPVIDLPISGQFPAKAAPFPLAAETELEYQTASSPATSRETPSTVTAHEGPTPTTRRRGRSNSRPILDDETHELVKWLLEEQNEISSADVGRLTGLNLAAARSLLKRLVEEGHAVQVGRGRGTRYRHTARNP